MKAKTALGAAIERAEHMLTLYDLLCDQRSRNVRSTWSSRFKKFMGWPKSDRISRVDGSNAMLIIRQQAGITRSHFGHDYLSEVLRYAVVAAVSALDRYVHDIVVEKSWILLTRPERHVPKKLAQLGLPALETRKALERLRKNPNARPGGMVKMAIQKQLHNHYTFQGVQQISVGAKLLGIDSFWAKVAKQFPGSKSSKEIQADLTNIVKRRNQIVHEADLVIKSKGAKLDLREMSRQHAGLFVDWIRNFTTAIDVVVESEV